MMRCLEFNAKRLANNMSLQLIVYHLLTYATTMENIYINLTKSGINTELNIGKAVAELGRTNDVELLVKSLLDRGREHAARSDLHLGSGAGVASILDSDSGVGLLASVLELASQSDVLGSDIAEVGGVAGEVLVGSGDDEELLGKSVGNTDTEGGRVKRRLHQLEVSASTSGDWSAASSNGGLGRGKGAHVDIGGNSGNRSVVGDEQISLVGIFALELKL